MKQNNRLLNHFNNMKIGKKIMVAFVLASIVPILAIQFIGYYMNSNSLKHKIDTLMVDNLTQLSERGRPDHGYLCESGVSDLRGRQGH